MKNNTILVLGGYGGTGHVVSRLLLQETNCSIIIAGRHIEKAEALSQKLRREFPNKSVCALYADASDYSSLIKAFEQASFVLDAAATAAHAKQVAEAALAAGIDYLDYHFQQDVFPVLKSLAPMIEQSGRCFITQAGFHPGLPSAFVRYAAPTFDQYEKAIIGMAMNAKIEKPESIYELIDALKDWKADILKDGKWRKSTYNDAKKINFGYNFKIRTCYPIQLEEMRPLPTMYGLQETGVYVAGFNWFVDYIVFPLAFILFKIKNGLGRHFLASLMAWGINHFSDSAQGVSFVLDAQGKKNKNSLSMRLVVEHHDAYEFTAIPVIACLLQYLDGSIAKPGLWMMGHLVDPVRLLNDMERMGIKIQITKTPTV